MKVSQLLDPRMVLTGLTAETKDAAISQLVAMLGEARGIDAAQAMQDISVRERTGTTLLPLREWHVAVPHASTHACKQLLLAVGTSRTGVPWDAGTERRANLIFVVLAPPQTRSLYLRVLSRIARLCGQNNLLESLLDAGTPGRLIDCLAEAEEPLGPIVCGEGMPTFCVLGAGAGGMAMAAHLALTGCRVNLFTRNPERLAPVRTTGGIAVTGEIQGFATLNRVTTHVAEAIQEVDVLMAVVPATAHQSIAQLVAPHIRDGQILILNPGRTGGTLEVARVLRSASPQVRPYLGEAQTLLYASRLTNPAQVHIFQVKNSVPLATLPAYTVADVLPVIRAALPQFVPGDNVLKTSLDNIGAVFHPAIAILNAARIENECGDFEFYAEGVTPSVAAVLEAIDRERVAVAGALGIRANSAREWLYLAYDAAGKTLLDAMRANPGYRGIKAPNRLEHRYITEDVPTSLVPIASIGESFGVPTPTIRAIIHLASTMHGVDYWAEGRTVERLGIAGMSVKDLRLLVVGAGPRPPEPQAVAQPVAADDGFADG